MKTMDFDFSTKEGRLNAAKEFADEFKQHISEDSNEAITVSYSDGEHIITNGAATPREMSGFITGMLHSIPAPLALLLLSHVSRKLMEGSLED